jgi:hypothetical protein
MRAVPRLCELYPGICLTTEEKAQKTSVRLAEELPENKQTHKKKENY